MHSAEPRELNRDEALAALVHEKCRFGRGDRGELMLEVLFEGRWLRVGRTDLVDDVATYILDSTDPEWLRDPVAHFRKKIGFGARVDELGFFAIDSYSDG